MSDYVGYRLFLAAHGFAGAHGFFASHGFAAHGFSAPHGFAAHGFFASHGFAGAQGFAVPHGLCACFVPAKAGAATMVMPTIKAKAIRFIFFSWLYQS
jgi:hypothetical protein